MYMPKSLNFDTSECDGKIHTHYVVEVANRRFERTRRLVSYQTHTHTPKKEGERQRRKHTQADEHVSYYYDDIDLDGAKKENDTIRAE